MMLVVALLAEEREPDQAEHVERSKNRGEQANAVEGFAAVVGVVGCKKNRVLREKSSDSDSAGEHAPESDFDFGGQASHVPHILLAAHGVNYAAGREEEQGLEEGVGHEVEDSGTEGSNAAGEEHVAKLTNGRIGQNFLDVGLNQAD